MELARWIPEPPQLQGAFKRALSMGIDAVAVTDQEYPPLLRQVNDPPPFLFYRGSIGVLTRSSAVAVIGSRRCSMYGRRAARKIAFSLASAGVCVVSGLARGIDGEAHRGALEAGGTTAAVFAGGLDAVYPPEHHRLALSIASSGVLVSEYPPGVRPARFTFPERNRIISGLSTALVVVEAGERSGTMITVGTALDQGRDVFAVPGEMGRSTSTGTNRLLRDGAGIVLSPGELLEDLGLTPVRSGGRIETDPLLQSIPAAGVTVEALQTETGLQADELQLRLFRLEMAGAVRRRPGGRFFPM